MKEAYINHNHREIDNNFQMVKQIESKQREKKQVPKCTICMESSARATVTCSHQFCMKCISRWVKRNQSCPLCREDIHEIKFGKNIKKVTVKRRRTLQPTFISPRLPPPSAMRPYILVGFLIPLQFPPLQILSLTSPLRTE